MLLRGVARVDCTTSAGASSKLMDSRAVGFNFLANRQGKLSFKEPLHKFQIHSQFE